MSYKRLSDGICIATQDVNKTIGNEYATVTRVNTDKTVNVHLDSSDKDTDDLIKVPLAVDFDLKKDDKVILTYLNNNTDSPVVIGMINPQFNGSGENGRSIVSIDKVDSDGLADIYRITYDKAPIYSYFSVKNGADGQQGLKGDKGDKGDQGIQGVSGAPSELSGKTIQHKVFIDSKTVTNVNSVEFDGLNGDEDGIYIIEVTGSVVYLGSVDSYLIVQFNGDTGSNYGSEEHLAYDGNNHNLTQYSNCVIGRSSHSLTTQVRSKTEFNVKTGSTRDYFTTTKLKNNTHRLAGYWGGEWNNTVDNITSISIKTTSNTFSGTITLYKLVDITYP